MRFPLAIIWFSEFLTVLELWFKFYIRCVILFVRELPGRKHPALDTVDPEYVARNVPIHPGILLSLSDFYLN